MNECVVPTRPQWLEKLWRPLGRREVFFWISIALFAHQAMQILDFRSVSSFADNLASQNFIYWFACVVVLKRISESADRPVATSDKFLAAGMVIAISIASLVPYRFAVGLMTTLMAVRFVTLRLEDQALKAAGVVMLALSAHLVWGPMLFQLLIPELLSVDAALVGGMLKFVRPDVAWTGNTFRSSTEFAISLVGGCSSFHNLSTALLACAAATMSVRTNWCRADLLRLLAAGCAMILMNDIRLCLLAWGPDSYAFWHEGAGNSLAALAMTAVMLAIAFSGFARPDARR